MRIDRDGNELVQVTVWITAATYRLMRADGLNVSKFIRDQIKILYGDDATAPNLDRDRLARAALESLARQQAAEAAREVELERARAAVHVMRAERDAAQARQDEIADALQQIIGDDPTGRYLRTLPENDTNGDRLDDWEALVRRVSRLCGAEIDSAEVAAGLRELIAAKA